MTKQETFNRVVNHLRQQGHRAFDSEALHCVYFNQKTGDKCAAGCLIPEDKYDSSFEGRSIDCPKIARILKEEKHDLFLVRGLQIIHDSKHVDEWENAFKELADEFYLEIP